MRPSQLEALRSPSLLLSLTLALLLSVPPARSGGTEARGTIQSPSPAGPGGTSQRPAQVSPEAYHQEIQELLRPPATASRARQALRLLRVATRRFPGSEPLQRLRGIAAFRVGKLSQAREAFQAAIALDPEVAFNHLKLASLELCAAGDQEGAQAVLRPFLAKRPQDRASRVQAAEMLSRCGAVEAAADLWQALARLVPEEAWRYHFRLAQLYFQGGSYGNARRILERVVTRCPPDQAEPLAQLGATLARMGEDEEARSWYRRALARAPEPTLEARLRAELDRPASRPSPGP